MLGLLFPALALANGQTTHVWICREALLELEPGPLADLLAAHEDALVHGCMFPDGGYAVDHPYGEAAHWEPFQGLLLQAIQDRWGESPAEWDEEAARQVAFLLGLAGHGMADQSFDSCYMNWSSVYDAEAGWAEGRSFDEASDVIWASLTGAQEVPDTAVPFDTLVEVYAEYGIEVDSSTLEEGQRLLGLAIDLVGLASANPDTVAGYQAQFPWGGAHLDDATLPGSPPDEARVVARYWQEIWERLLGTDSGERLMVSYPADGSPGHPTDATDPAARVTFVFARALASADVEHFGVVDQDGTAAVVTPWLFYGDHSHVVHLVPAADWALDTDYLATARAGLPFADGTVLTEDLDVAFGTGDPPEDASEAPPLTEAEASGCRCAAAPTGGWLGWPVLALAWGHRRRRGGPASPRAE